MSELRHAAMLAFACLSPAACGNERGPDEAVTFRPPVLECHERSAYAQHLYDVITAIRAEWQLPPSFPAGANPSINLRVGFDEEGRLREVLAPGGEDEAVKRSALAAATTARMPPLPDDLVCIADQEHLALEFRFRPEER